MEYFKRNYTTISLVLFYVFLPLIFINNLWDGVIYDHLLEENDLKSLKRNFSELRYEIFYFIHILINFLNTQLNLPLFLIQDFSISLVLYLTFLEICKISNIFINLKVSTFKLGLIFFSMPYWHSLTSFPNFINIFLIFLSLLGFRLFLKKNYLINLIGIIILAISFNLKSTITLIIGIVFFYFYINKFLKIKNLIPKKKFYLTIIFSLSMIFFYYKFFLPYGEYMGHNSFNIDELKILNLTFDTINFINYFFFVIIYLIFSLLNYKNKKKIFNITSFIFLVFLIVIFPYVVVSKSPNIFTFSSFDGRHGFTFGIVLMLSIIFLLNQDERKKINKIIISLLITLNTFILFLGYAAKYEHSLYVDVVFKNIKKIEVPKKGEVIFKVIGGQPAILAFYELNYIFKKVYKKNNWLITNYSKDVNLERMANDEYFKKKYVMNNYNKNCSTSIYLKGFENSKDRILFFIYPERYFKIINIKEKC